LIDQESGIPDPEGKLANAWGKDAEYVSELETVFRNIGLDPIVHLYHVDDLDAVMDSLSVQEDLIFNACLGSDGLEVAWMLEKRGFCKTVGLNAQFFQASRSHPTVRALLNGNRLPTPSGITAHAGQDAESVLALLKESRVYFPVYVKPVQARRHLEGESSGVCIQDVNELQTFLQNNGDGDWVIENYYTGRSFRVLVAGDARDPNADVIVFPPVIQAPPASHHGVLRATAAATGPQFFAKNLMRLLGHRQSLRAMSIEKAKTAAASNQMDGPMFSAMSARELMLQMDIQDLARRAFVAVHGSCYGLVHIIETENAGLMVVNVSGDVWFGQNAKAGSVLSLAGLGTEDLFRWLTNRPVHAGTH
jgi:hypothetical protein